MIGPGAALDLVREELRSSVLPRLAEDDDYGRSVLVAAIGVLGELAARVVEDEAWALEPTERLARTARSWPARLPGAALADLPREADGGSGDGAGERRARVLAACDATAVALWPDGPVTKEATDSVLHRLRIEFLAAMGQDIESELARADPTRRRHP